jgi:uncharacterized protein (DUF1330 family)
MASIEPSIEQFQQLMAGDDDAPVVMINLLRYADRASYPSDFDASSCSGREAYARYGAVAQETVAAVGGRILWFGNVRALVIGPADEAWDDAVLVEYPSRQAFIDMMNEPRYQAAAPHRSAALADSRLIATSTLANFLRD